MGSKWHLFSAIFQLVVGIAAVAAYFIIAAAGEPMGKWTITLFLALAFVVLGVVGIIDYIKLKR